MTDRDPKPANMIEARRRAREAAQPHAILVVFCDVCGLRHGSGPPSQFSLAVVPVAADWTTLECPRCGGQRSTARLVRDAEANPPPPELAPAP